MRPVYAASFVAALVCHALLLFGFKMESSARPLPVSDEPSSVDVSLVASAPESQPAEQTAPPEAAPTAASTPPPAMPTPTPAPAVEMSTPPPEPVQTPSPEIVSSPSTETPVETPAPHPRAQNHPRKNGQPAASTLQGEARTDAGAHSQAGTGATYRSNPKPEYPEEAKRLHQEGVVLLNVEVSAEGLPTKVTLERSSGFDLLDQAAIRTVKQRWTFYPRRVGALPVASDVSVPIHFSLNGRNDE